MSNNELEDNEQLKDQIASIRTILDNFEQESAARYVDIDLSSMSQLIEILEPLVRDRFWMVKRSSKTQSVLTSLLESSISCQRRGWECRSVAVMFLQWLEDSPLAREKGLPKLAAIAFGLEK
jgi:hypothetical protein